MDENEKTEDGGNDEDGVIFTANQLLESIISKSRRKLFVIAIQAERRESPAQVRDTFGFYQEHIQLPIFRFATKQTFIDFTILLIGLRKYPNDDPMIVLNRITEKFPSIYHTSMKSLENDDATKTMPQPFSDEFYGKSMARKLNALHGLNVISLPIPQADTVEKV